LRNSRSGSVFGTLEQPRGLDRARLFTDLFRLEIPQSGLHRGHHQPGCLPSKVDRRAQWKRCWALDSATYAATTVTAILVDSQVPPHSKRSRCSTLPSRTRGREQPPTPHSPSSWSVVSSDRFGLSAITMPPSWAPAIFSWRPNFPNWKRRREQGT
jgi:hypothetical protein